MSDELCALVEPEIHRYRYSESSLLQFTANCLVLFFLGGGGFSSRDCQLRQCGWGRNNTFQVWLMSWTLKPKHDTFQMLDAQDSSAGFATTNHMLALSYVSAKVIAMILKSMSNNTLKKYWIILHYDFCYYELCCYATRRTLELSC